MNEIKLLRVVLKTIILFVVANILFAVWRPPVGFLSIYNWLVPGRLRVPYERELEYYPISHTIPIFENMDAMFHSHIISRPKALGEFRVALVGDSSTWAFELHPAETLASQLNALNLTTCGGKRIIVYNVAFPLPYVAKDLLIIDKVREYKPDMFVWLITLDAFRNRSIYTDYFLDPYSERVLALTQQYHLGNLDIRKLKVPSFLDYTIIGESSQIKKIITLQLHGLAWGATGLDYYYRSYEPLSNNQSDSLLFDVYKPGKLDLNGLLFDVLGAGYGVVGKTSLLVINEPIFIASGINSNVRYNEFYPRWAFDYYVQYLSNWMKTNHHDYLDLWNALPASGFTDTPFHRTPEGEKTMANLIAPKLLEMACLGH